MKDEGIFRKNNEIFDLQDEISRLKAELEKCQTSIKSEPEFLRPDKTFGLAVTGDVQLNKLEVEIINSKTFQRLRKVKQLGATYMVYPSTVHTRFEHSLGVLSKASIIINKITKNRHSGPTERYISADEEQIVRLLALLHDIGHMPFGHTIEDEFGIFRSHDKHETRWEYFLGESSEIGKLILKEHPRKKTDLYDRFFKLIKCEKNFVSLEKDAFMYDIVSDTVCADLLDYIERDGFYCNLRFKYHSRFLDYFFIRQSRNLETMAFEKRIAIKVYKTNKNEIRYDTLSELVQLLRYRYTIGERVYYHHAKIMSGTILAAAVARAKKAGCFESIINKHDESEENKLFLEKIQENDDDAIDKDIYTIHEMGDEELILYIKKLDSKNDSNPLVKSNKSAAVRLINCFDDRILYKQIRIYKKASQKTDESLEISKEQLAHIRDYIKYMDLSRQAKVEIEKKKYLEKADCVREIVGGSLAFRLYSRLLMDGSSEKKVEVEDQICDYLEDMLPGDVLIYCPNFDMAMKVARAKIAYRVENEQASSEVDCPLAEFPDDDIRAECDEIIKKHQSLWAFRIFVNKKFVDKNHPEYDTKYSKYESFIAKYIEWRFLGRSIEDEKQKGEIFFKEFIRDRMHLIGLNSHAYTQAVDEKIEVLSSSLVVQNNSSKGIKDIDLMIQESFKNA